MGPLIRPPSQELTRGLKTLEDDESWLVMPEHVVGNPNLYRPGVKWNIRPGGFSHLTELFGPVLGVMPFSRLEEAIEIVRRTGYGLTSGLESLDDREIELWKQSIHAGNLYINRATTGAIVLRQPFGGIGLSGYGPGVKAGGPHYVLPLMRIDDGTMIDHPPNVAHPELNLFCEWLDERESEKQIGVRTYREVVAACDSARQAVESEFSGEHDSVRLIGQDNLRRYRPVRALTIRVHKGDTARDVLIAISSAIAMRCQFTLSIDPGIDELTRILLESTADVLPGLIHPVDESDDELAQRILRGDVGRLRLLHQSAATSLVVIACAESFITIVDEPVVLEGRIECLRYLDEQSISHEYHRYGNLGRRGASF
jgi:RHH-type proline utilization regulon transcriptional repressor/proline dehydrogenase/delta 1-pyrroline-5-carboxylate dehydrogenase